MKYILVGILFISVLSVNAAPFWDDDDWDFEIPDISDIKTDCTHIGCDEGTSACSKRTSTTEDKKFIKTEIRCFSANGEKTKDDTTTEKNPSPHSIQSGYEFFGSYSSGTQTITINNSDNDGVNTGIETLEK